MKNVIRCVFFVALMTGLFFNGRSLREESGKTKTVIIENELPPSLQVGAIALGPLKGLVTDVLWWRAERLKDNKEFFEALQLAEWITSMQPTYPSVWSYQAFDLSFNVSVNFTEPEERWRWVLAGIELLRDKGLQYNPDWQANTVIRHELINIFYSKLMSASDVETRYFQDQWTIQMLQYFGTGKRRELEAINNAHANVEKLLEESAVKEFAEVLTKRSVSLREVLAKTQTPAGFVQNGLSMTKAFTPGLVMCYRYLQKKLIPQKLKMDIARMLKWDEQYGPLDWRSHEAQIIYWGMEQDYEQFKSDGTNYSSYVREAMLSSFRNGRIQVHPKTGVISRTHNLQVLARLHEFFDFLLYKSLKKGSPRWHKENLIHREFLQQAIVITYMYNQEEASRELYAHYRSYMDRPLAFKQYIVRAMSNSLRHGSYKNQRSFIESILNKALQSTEAGQWDVYKSYYKLAALVHRSHQRRSTPGKQLPPFKDLFAAAKQSYFEAKEGSEDALTKFEEKESLYKKPASISTGTHH
ncbi:MAG: hypothetical protein HRT88_15725 [Lentisphaeraceae bacterium]|nr:hypothetical protein [Lentisphaeraceae bacterium]